jgi:2-hydroxy-6-oxonona-2,4-dienedioate hydrolase
VTALLSARARTTASLGAVVVAAFASVAALALRYHKQIGGARARLGSLGSQVIETDCGPTEYLRRGDGYPLLVVHGAMGGFDQGLWVADHTAMSPEVPSLQVIAISRFGHLRSPVPEGADLNLQADAYACLLDELDIHEAVVLALSSGSTSALRFAARHPGLVSALVLICPDAPPGMPPPPRFIFDTVLRSDFVYWAAATFFSWSVERAAGLVPKGYVLTSGQKASMKQILKATLPVSKRVDGFIFETYTTADEFQAFVSSGSPFPLSGIEAPVLIVNALDDPISTPENVRRLAELLPSARQFVVPDGGHFLLGHTDEVRAEIARFLVRHVAKSVDH